MTDRQSLTQRLKGAEELYRVFSEEYKKAQHAGCSHFDAVRWADAACEAFIRDLQFRLDSLP